MAASTSNKKSGLSLIQDELWYAGALSERKAEQVLEKLGNKGAFLVRDSLLPDADYVLSVKGREDIDHYQITVAADEECALNGYTFNNISDAVEFYTENRIGKVFLNLPEEPVVSQVVVPKNIVPKIKPAPVPVTHQPSPQTTTDTPVVPFTSVNETSESALTSPQKSEPITSNTELKIPEIVVSQTASNESQKPETLAIESTDTNEIGTPETLQESNSTKNEEKQATQDSKEANHQDEPQTNSSAKEPITPSATKDSNKKHDEPTNESPRLAQTNIEEKRHDEVNNAKVVPSVNNVESSGEASKNNNDIKDVASTPLPQMENTAENTNAQMESLPNPKNVKAEQNNELKQLPSIGDKKKALEAKLRGEVEKSEKKRKVPPPVPKRVSTATDLFQAVSIKTKQDDSNPNSEVVQSNAKKAPLPALKKLFIPANFQQNNDENSDQKATSPTEPPKRLIIPESLQQNEENPDKKVTSPTETPKRVVIPISLQVKPPPPPLSTHPGLAKKEEERQQQELQKQQQLLQVEAEKPQPQKSKKRSSFFKKKNKDSDKDKATVKRTPSIKADEPVTLKEAEQKKQQEQEEASTNPPPRPPKKVIGVPTLAISPQQLEASGGRVEIESIFKTITKHEWHPEDNKTKKEVEISTFGQYSREILKESTEPEKNFKPVTNPESETKPQQQKSDVPKQKTPIKKGSIGAMTGVNTFHPDGFSTPPDLKETNFTFSTPVSTEIYLNADFLQQSSYNSQDTPPRTPTSIMNSSSASSIGISDTSFSTQSPTAKSSTPRTPTSSQKTTPKLKARNAPPSSTIPAINVPSSNSEPLSKNNEILPQSKSTGSLPSGFIVTAAGKMAAAVHPFSSQHPFSGQHRSIVDVVPGISKTLPRGQSMEILEEEDVDSPIVSKRKPLRRSSTISGNEMQSSIGPMNSKRTGTKKKNIIFKKK